MEGPPSLSSPLIPSGIIAAGVMLMDDPSRCDIKGKRERWKTLSSLEREHDKVVLGGELRRLLKGFDSAE